MLKALSLNHLFSSSLEEKGDEKKPDEKPDEKPGKPQRTHWDMLLERRSEEELQVLLDQRLALLRAGKLHQRRNL